MNTLRRTAVAIGWVALLALGTASVSTAQESLSSRTEVSVLGGIQALNQNDTAFPDNFVNVPAAAALTYHLNRIWAVEGEFTWLIPVKKSVDLGSGVTQDLKTPDILAYQANVVAKLPTSAGPWTPYAVAGAGATTFLSSTEADRLPQLPKSQTAFAVNFGAGTSYGLTERTSLRLDFREFVAFPAKDAVGLSDGNTADPIWMERGTIGLAYRF